MDQVAKDALCELLQPERLTAIVDIGANPVDGDPLYKQMLAAGLCTVIGFEPQAAALAELDRKRGPHERYLPYAVGDGRERTLYIRRGSGWTSLLPPDPNYLGLFAEFASAGVVERELQVATRRLDDIEEIERMDFLKIDIQGGELDVFESGRCRLASAVVVQTEVPFIHFYRNQPSFGIIDTLLRQMGFILHCFAELKLRPIAPLVLDGNPRIPVRQFVEADAVYVRDFSRADNMDGEQWKQLAMVAHHCYGSIDLALRAITAAAQLGALKPSAAGSYMNILNSQGPRTIRAIELT